MTIRARLLASLMLIVVLAGGSFCTTAQTVQAVKPLELSGEALDGVFHSFVAINKIYVYNCDVTKTMKPATCNAYLDFAEKFKKNYRPAVDAWSIARRTNDTVARGNAAGIITGLSTDLAVFAVSIIDLAKGGNK